jgi:dienelactone hydrolase
MQFSVRCFLSVVAASILLSFVAVHASFLSQSSKSSRSSSAAWFTRTRVGVGVGSSHSRSSSSSMTLSAQLQDLYHSNDNMNDDDLWSPLDPESLVSAPCLIEQTLCQAGDDGPRVAKDYDYAVAVLDAWKAQEAEGDVPWNTESRPIAYSCTDDSAATTTTTLYGRLIRRRRRRPRGESSTPTAPSTPSNTKIPGIVFFHTGAGPHDVFLLWKAAALVNSMMLEDADDSDDDGPTILVADILSDATGWAWDDDKTQYMAVRDTVLAVNDNGNNDANGSQYRPVLQQRIRAAIDTLLKVDPRVDPENLAALGWCLGGHSILELGRMQTQQESRMPWRMRAMVTFHGVFDGLPPPPAEEELDQDSGNQDDTDTDVNGNLQNKNASPPQKKTEILICHGLQDPFVSDQSLERALATLTVTGHIVSLLQLQGAKHGFTNPAQDFNDNPAFAFDANSANKAWRQTMALLRRACATDS